jgi:DNA-binding IclR family transcriptional regulator
MSIFEVLAENPEGMTPPELVDTSGVPNSTVHRILEDWFGNGIITTRGKHRKSTIYRLNTADDLISLMVARLTRFNIDASMVQARRHQMQSVVFVPQRVPEQWVTAVHVEAREPSLLTTYGSEPMVLTG